MGANLPLVSIGVPVYNGEKLLAASLGALVGQDHPDLEIVVSDNGSTDSTPGILAKFAERDPRIVVVRQPRNLGAAANFVEVLERAKGEFFMWAACGDYWNPGYVRCLSDLLVANRDAALAVSLVGLIDGETGVLKNEFWHGDPVPTVGLPKAERLIRHLARKGSDVGTYGHMVYGLFRREILVEENRKFIDTGFDFGIDVLLLLSVFGRGGLAVHPERLLWYRTGGGSAGFRFKDVEHWRDYRRFCTDRILQCMDLSGIGYEDLMRLHKAQMRFADEFTGGESPFQADLIRKALAV